MVEKYLKKYEKRLPDFQKRAWWEKMIITEKAIIKSKLKKLKTRVNNPTSYEDEVDAIVEVKDEARVDEVGAEKHPKPPAEDADEKVVK